MMHDKLAPPIFSFISTEAGDLKLSTVQGGTSIRIDFSNGGSTIVADPDRIQRALRLLDIIERPELHARNAVQRPSPKPTIIPPKASELRETERKAEAERRRQVAFDALFGSPNTL